MYLNDLEGLVPIGTGKIDLSDQGKYPYISFGDDNFQKENEKSTFGSDYFPFVQIKMGDRKVFNVSEPNLIKIFTYAFQGNANERKITVNHSDELTIKIAEELKRQFYDGYLYGYSNFSNELGLSFLSYDIPTKKIALEDFGRFCFSALYFEGFATPTCLYILGYVNACYLKAWKEYNNLNHIIKIASKDSVNKTVKANIERKKLNPDSTLSAKKEQFDKPEIEKFDNSKTSTIESQVLEESSKIELTSFVDDICNLWMILIEIHNIPQFSTCLEYKKRDDVMNLLGMMFRDNLHPHKLTDVKFEFQSRANDYRDILDLLGHATYKFNKKIGLKGIAETLKSTFSCYDGIEVETIEKNMTQKRKSTIESINKLDTEISIEAIKTLRKIQGYDIKLK